MSIRLVGSSRWLPAKAASLALQFALTWGYITQDFRRVQAFFVPLWLFFPNVCYLKTLPI
jgi:hypothetical protein